jgi:U3 small nucleolar RNA-associated protein 6
MALEKLRALRSKQVLLKRKALLRGNKQGDEKQKDHDNHKSKQKPMGDVHIVQHVHLLFVRAIRKFKSDVSLYLQHAAFCKQVKSFSRLTRIYAEAVQIHPKNVGLWIEAASHEYFGVAVEEESPGSHIKKQVVHGGGSVRNARIILQRGLRVNPNSQELWLQAFGLELHYIQKLRGRQAIMLSDQQRDDADVDSVKQLKTTPTSVPSSLPLLVYKNAVRKIPDDLTFRLKFVDLCQMFPNESVSDLQRHVMDTVREDFSSEPSGWIAWATHVAKTRMESNDNENIGFLGPNEKDDDNQEEEPPQKRSRSSSNTIENESSSTFPTGSDHVLEVLTEATNKIPTAEMLLLSVQFAHRYTASLFEAAGAEARFEGKQASVTYLTSAIQDMNDFVHKLFDRAERLGIQTPELVLEQVNLLLGTESKTTIAAALDVLESFCTKKLPPPGANDASKIVPSAVWIRWAELLLLSENNNNDALTQQRAMSAKALDVLRMGLNHTPITVSSHYMIILLHLVNGLIMMTTHGESNDFEDKSCDDELARLFQQMLLLAPGQIDTKLNECDSQFSEWFGQCSISKVCFNYLRLQHARKGLNGARSVFHLVLFQHQLPPATWVAHDAEGWKSFVDECILIESNEVVENPKGGIALTQKGMRRQRLDRLYQLAMKLFRESHVGDYYKQQREDKLSVQN